MEVQKLSILKQALIFLGQNEVTDLLFYEIRRFIYPKKLYCESSP
jgi:hypothetical protein